MGCFGEREHGPTAESQKWEFLTLSDFRCTSGWTVFAYVWLWILAITGIIVVGLDTFTAINLLAFNRWSSQVQPALDFKYSKWIFTICILLSFALLAYESWRALRVLRRGGVAESYLDPLAATWQSMRGQGWKRFLVFTELTKSRKGLDYVALFTYFEFKEAIRILLAEGPRQAVNGMTLYAVMQAELLGPAKDNHSPIVQFFVNVQAVAEKDTRQALIYFSMLFTLVIWVFSFICLVIAALMWVVFLWHSIHERLSKYCRTKIEKRLAKIVESKVKAGLEEDERQRLKALRKEERKADRKPDLKKSKTNDWPTEPPPPKLVRQPTLPQLGDSPHAHSDDKLPEFQLARQDTNTSVATLPPYDSRPPTRNAGFGGQEPPGSNRPGMPSRTGTQASNWSNTSYASNAPLLANASGPGEAEPAMAYPPPTAWRQDSLGSSNQSMPPRTMSQATQRSLGLQDRAMSQSPHGERRPQLPMLRTNSDTSQLPYTSSENPHSQPPPRIPLPVRSNTAFSFEQPTSASSARGPPRNFGPPPRQDTADSFSRGPTRQDSYASSMNAPTYPPSRQPTPGNMSNHPSFSRPAPGRQASQASNFARPFSPAPARPMQTESPDSYEMTPQPPRSMSTQPPSTGYLAFDPPRANSTAPMGRPGPSPQRNVTIAGPPGVEGNYFGHVHPAPQRSVTAPIEPRHTIGYSGILDDYGSTPPDEGHLSRDPSPPAPRPHLSRAATIEPQSDYGTRGPSPPGPGLPRAATAGPQGEDWRQQRW